VFSDLRQLAMPIAITVSFFVFGFMVTADMLDLSLREIAIGLISGAVCGLTTLVVTLHQMRTSSEPKAIPSV
jgi:hypothetical protein